MSKQIQQSIKKNIPVKNKKGQVFTPEWIVHKMLEDSGFLYDEQLLDKCVLEPACGEGAFLVPIVKEYIERAMKRHCSEKELCAILERQIVAYDIDDVVLQICIQKLNQTIKDNGINTPVKWNLYRRDILREEISLEKYDYILGNPPYIHIHDLQPEDRFYLRTHYQFCQKGMIDIYLAFFELALKICKTDGMIAFITPNSFMVNAFARRFRKYLIQERLIVKIIDFKSEKVFTGTDIYCAITFLCKHNQSDFIYATRIQTYNSSPFSMEKENVIKPDDKKIKTQKQLEEYEIPSGNDLFEEKRIFFEDYLDKPWAFNYNIIDNEKSKDKQILKKWQKNKNDNITFSLPKAQHGLATLRDYIFASYDWKELSNGNLSFRGVEIEKDLCLPAIKGSSHSDTDVYAKMIFPYFIKDSLIKPMEESYLQKHYPLGYHYLLTNKEELLLRKVDKGAVWYQYGRSQGMQNMLVWKLAFKTLIKDTISILLLPPKVLVYSGVFIPGEKEELELLMKILQNSNFLWYVQNYGKRYSGNYFGLTARIINDYLKTI